MLIFTTDKARLARHFQHDPVLYAYHLGDLDDFFFPFCQWASIYQPTRAIIQETVLIYSGSAIPTVLMFGLSDQFDSLMSDLVDLLPPKFHGHFQEATGELLLTRYDQVDLGSYLKMKLEDSDKLLPHLNHNHELCKLDESDLDRLRLLYESAYPENYFIDRMLQTGKYYAIKSGNKIVSVAGVHVCSIEQKIAALGNIATHPDYRGRGLGKVVTAHLASQLAAEGMTVCLNVSANNSAAISMYEQLGFVKSHEYREALFELR